MNSWQHSLLLDLCSMSISKIRTRVTTKQRTILLARAIMVPLTIAVTATRIILLQGATVLQIRVREARAIRAPITCFINNTKRLRNRLINSTSFHKRVLSGKRKRKALGKLLANFSALRARINRLQRETLRL